MPAMYLIRGLPGSGKSTLADNIVNTSTISNGFNTGCVKVEADQFFTSSNGHTEIYNFDRRFLGAAHDECYGRAMRHFREGYSVAVANTFSTQREIDRYINGLQRCGFDTAMRDYRLSIIKCVGNYKSVHNVPRKAIDKMRARWEDIDGEIIFNGDWNV